MFQLPVRCVYWKTERGWRQHCHQPMNTKQYDFIFGVRKIVLYKFGSNKIILLSGFTKNFINSKHTHNTLLHTFDKVIRSFAKKCLGKS